MIGEPVPRTILALDIEGFTRPERTDRDRLELRDAVYRLLGQALRGAGIGPGDYVSADQGDGALILLDPTVPKTRVLPWPILRLAAGLQRHNQSAPASRQLRLRVAMHAGEVVHDAHGYTGKDLNLAFRLLDAQSLRSHLASARTSLALVISDSIYYDIVVQGHGDIGPDAFQPIPITGKNVDTQAWMYLPGRHHAGPAERRTGPAEGIAVPTVPRELPTDAHHFTGREVELEWLLATLRQTGGVAATAVALYGVGGVGKSALAVHAAHLLAAEFPDGQLYVNLQGATEGLDPLDPKVVVGRLLRALGLEGRDIPPNLEEAATRLRSRMADRRILLLLDNATSVEQVRPLLPASLTCAVLITSRERLGTLDAASRRLDALGSAAAVRLLGELAGTDRASAEPQAIAEVARQCGYLPLALRIAGARLSARDPHPGRVQALAERLADERTRLDELELADLAVRSSFQVSYQALAASTDKRDRSAARMFRLLGVHQGPDIGVRAAASLLDVSPPVAEAALERLVDAQLLESPAPRRYRMHDLLLLFSRERADQDEPAPQRDAACDRMLRFYLETARNANRLLQPAALDEAKPPPAHLYVQPLLDHTQAFAWFEAEHANLLAATHQAADGPGAVARLAADFTLVTYWYFWMRTYWSDLESVARIGLRAARRQGDRHGLARALNDLGWACVPLGRYDHAIGYLETSSTIFHELGDRRWEATALTGAGAAYRQQRRLGAAVDRLERARAYARAINSAFTEGFTLNVLGIVYHDQGRFDDAIECFKQSIRIRAEIGDRHGEATALAHLGEAHHRAGLANAAIRFYEDSMWIYRRTGDSRRQAEILWRLAHALEAVGRHRTAQAHRSEAKAIFKALELPEPTTDLFAPDSRISSNQLI